MTNPTVNIVYWNVNHCLLKRIISSVFCRSHSHSEVRRFLLGNNTSSERGWSKLSDSSVQFNWLLLQQLSLFSASLISRALLLVEKNFRVPIPIVCRTDQWPFLNVSSVYGISDLIIEDARITSKRSWKWSKKLYQLVEFSKSPIQDVGIDLDRLTL